MADLPSTDQMEQQVRGAKVVPPTPTSVPTADLLALRKSLVLYLRRHSRAAKIPEVARALDEVRLEIEFLLRPNGTIYLGGLEDKR